jgi:UPF0716 protein FxsA
MRLLGLFALFILLPIAELYVIYKVGDSIGILPTLLLLAADSVIGSLLLRSQGRTAWRKLNEALAQGRMPVREVQDGVAVVFGGAFLITPGFLTDIFGVLLLLPPTRALIRNYAVKRFSSTVSVRVASGAARRVRREPGAEYDVDSSATEYPAPDTRRLER